MSYRLEEHDEENLCSSSYCDRLGGCAVAFPIGACTDRVGDSLHVEMCWLSWSDGAGSAMGKAMGAHDLASAEVQQMSDAQLSDIITNGKSKMPAYGKSLKPDDIKGLVAYIRTLKK